MNYLTGDRGYNGERLFFIIYLIKQFNIFSVKFLVWIESNFLVIGNKKKISSGNKKSFGYPRTNFFTAIRERMYFPIVRVFGSVTYQFGCHN